MIVCTHGDVDNFCKSRYMVPVCKHDGNIEDYSGICRILVTDSDFTEKDYYLKKSEMLSRGIELVSTRYEDSEFVSQLIVDNLEKNRRTKHGGRCKFGFQNIDGELRLTEKGRVVVKKIFELRDAGCPYQVIREAAEVRHPDGRKMAVSTIQFILKNRSAYTEWLGE